MQFVLLLILEKIESGAKMLREKIFNVQDGSDKIGWIINFHVTSAS